MISASRTLAVLAGGVIFGFFGGIAAGLLMDGSVTAIESGIHGEFRPHGLIENFTNMNFNPGKIFDAVGGIYMDGKAG